MNRIAVVGAAGRMGRHLVEACHINDQAELKVAIMSAKSSFIGHDAGEVAGMGRNHIQILASLQTAMDDFDVAIDFTRPEVTLVSLETCVKANKKIVIGTTGFTAEQKAIIKKASEKIAIVFAPNMAVGMNLCFKLAEIAAQILQDEYDVEIIEAHHRHKLDAPSGTALHMGEVVAKALGRNLKDCAVYGRQGHTGERDSKTIGFETIRAGDIIGEHTIMFATQGERVEIMHRASSRINFAKGAVRAANWLMQKSSGLYDMQDVLGLK